MFRPRPTQGTCTGIRVQGLIQRCSRADHVTQHEPEARHLQAPRINFMHLQEIIVQLDAELDRLTDIRTIVAGLASPVATSVKRFHVQPASAPPGKPESREEPVSPKPRTRRPRKLRVARTQPTPTKTVVEPTALTGAVPSGPVVVSVAALERE